MPFAFQSHALIESNSVCVSEWFDGGDTLDFPEPSACFGSQVLCVTGQEWAGGTFSDLLCHRPLQNGWAIKPSGKHPMDILFSSTKFFFFVCVFLLFLGLIPWHMEIPRLGVQLKL